LALYKTFELHYYYSYILMVELREAMTQTHKICAICGKGYSRSQSRSHSMQKTLRRLLPNLQWTHLPSGKRVKACTKCIKSASRGKIKPQNFVITQNIVTVPTLAP